MNPWSLLIRNQRSRFNIMTCNITFLLRFHNNSMCTIVGRATYASLNRDLLSSLRILL